MERSASSNADSVVCASGPWVFENKPLPIQQIRQHLKVEARRRVRTFVFNSVLFVGLMYMARKALKHFKK